MTDDSRGEVGSEAEEPPRPEAEVWNHLWSGYDLAYHDLQETVGGEAAKFFDLIGSAVYTALTRLFVDPADPSLTTELLKAFPGLSAIDQAALFQKLFRAYKDGTSPVLKHSVDLQLASEAISRAQEALNRLRLLIEVLANASLPARVREYLAEVVHTFLFGFDAASIALARSAFEQMAREVLIHRRFYTRARLDREKPTAFTLLHELKRNALIDIVALKAETLVTRGNTIAHKHMYEERIMQQQALASIAELVEVLTALAAHLPQSPESAA